MSDCIFCKISAGEAPATYVYQDDDVIAIKTIGPIAEGHTLVIPRKHSENVLEIDKETLAKVMSVTSDLSKSLKEKFGASGINLLHAAGKDAQQSVFHFHMHIVPRHENDGLDLWFRQGIEKE